MEILSIFGISKQLLLYGDEIWPGLLPDWALLLTSLEDMLYYPCPFIIDTKTYSVLWYWRHICDIHHDSSVSVPASHDNLHDIAAKNLYVSITRYVNQQLKFQDPISYGSHSLIDHILSQLISCHNSYSHVFSFIYLQKKDSYSGGNQLRTMLLSHDSDSDIISDASCISDVIPLGVYRGTNVVMKQVSCFNR